MMFKATCGIFLTVVVVQIIPARNRCGQSPGKRWPWQGRLVQGARDVLKERKSTRRRR